jgi:hypothetical protein
MAGYKKKITFALIFIIVVLILWIVVDIFMNNQIEKIPSKSSEIMEEDATEVLWALENNEKPDYDILIAACDFVDARYDKADFSIQILIRILYEYGDELPNEMHERVKDTLLSFKFWMDQPGEESINLARTALAIWF